MIYFVKLCYSFTTPPFGSFIINIDSYLIFK